MADLIQLFGVGLDTRQVELGTARASRGLAGMQKSAVAAAAKFAALAAAAGAAAVAFDKMISRGGDVVNVGGAFARQVGDQERALIKLRAASRGLVSDLDLMTQFNRAVTLGAVQNTNEFARLSETAIELGKALRVDAGFALESLSLGIGRQSKLILDNLGIIVNAEQAYRNFAEGLGVAVSALNEAQRRQAFNAEVFRAAEAAITELGGSVETNADGWNRLKTSITNATDSLLEFLATSRLVQGTLGAAGAGVEGVTTAPGMIQTMVAEARAGFATVVALMRGMFGGGPAGFAAAAMGLSGAERAANLAGIPTGAGGGGGGGGRGFAAPSRGLALATGGGVPGVRMPAALSATDALMMQIFGPDGVVIPGLEGMTEVMSDFDSQVREFNKDLVEAGRRSVLLGQTIVSVVGSAIATLISGGGAGGFLGSLLGGAGAIVSGFNPIIGAALGVGGGLVGSLFGGGGDDPIPVRIEDISDRAVEKQVPRDPVVNLFFKGDQISSGSLADAAANLREFTRRTGQQVLNG